MSSTGPVSVSRNPKFFSCWYSCLIVDHFKFWSGPCIQARNCLHSSQGVFDILFSDSCAIAFLDVLGIKHRSFTRWRSRSTTLPSSPSESAKLSSISVVPQPESRNAITYYWPVSPEATTGSTSTKARPPVSQHVYADCRYTSRGSAAWRGDDSLPYGGERRWVSLNFWHLFWFTFRFCPFYKFQVDFMYKGMYDGACHSFQLWIYSFYDIYQTMTG